MFLGISDHSPILNNLHIPPPKNLHPKPFKLYNTVINHFNFRQKVREAWSTVILDPIKVD